MGMGWVSSGVAFLVGSPIAGALLATGSSESEQKFNFVAAQLWSGILLFAGASTLCVLWWLLIRKEQAGGVWI
jgi:hypothetical protein